MCLLVVGGGGILGIMGFVSGGQRILAGGFVTNSQVLERNNLS